MLYVGLLTYYVSSSNIMISTTMTFFDKIRETSLSFVFKTLALAKHPGGIIDSGVDHFLMVVQ